MSTPTLSVTGISHTKDQLKTEFSFNDMIEFGNLVLVLQVVIYLANLLKLNP